MPTTVKIIWNERFLNWYIAKLVPTPHKMSIFYVNSLLDKLLLMKAFPVGKHRTCLKFVQSAMHGVQHKGWWQLYWRHGI